MAAEKMMPAGAGALDALMILGPTASGKTALSLALARRLEIEVISVDSALVYRGMDIGTAKPAPAEREGVPHHLIDVRGIDDPYSVADFVADCRRLIPEIQARGRLPVLAGGTMLYANALLKGMSELPSSTPEVREAVLREGLEKGWPAMHAELARFDPATAARLAPADSQRISRATEVYRMTGRPLSELIAERPSSPPPFSILTTALIPGDRKRLHEQIRKRFDAMLEAGFLDEVRRLMASPGFDAESPAMRSVGYRQAIEHLRGAVDFEIFREKAIAATRQLAKRQITWLRSMPQKVVFDPQAPEMPQEAIGFLLSQAWKAGRERKGSRPA